jgi:penicillin-binding protein 1A
MRISARELLEGPPPRGSSSGEGGAGDDRPRWRKVLADAWFWGRRVALVLGVLAVLGLVALIVVIHHLESDLPSVSELKGNYHPPQVTRVLARDGTLLAELYTQRRTVVPIAQLPAHVKLAVLAAEDAGFYEHEGLNYLGILRALVVNLRAGHTRQGGSTITQQVVRNVLLNDTKRTWGRKLREALLSRRLESELTKDEILEMYLNEIYLGRGRYGVDEAARDDFAKGARDLTIAEAALIMGRISSPENYSPRVNMKYALERRAYVLDQMHGKGFLPDAAWQAAKDEPVRLAPEVEAKSELAPEAIAMAKRVLKEVAHEDASRGGYTITTTIDPKIQEAARKALRDGLSAYDKRHGLQGAMKAPPEPSATKKGKAPPPSPRDAPFDGTPSFESHKVYVGVVEQTDDAAGTIDARVGNVVGSLRIADCDRYNVQHLVPSQFAPAGARVRVSLLASVPPVVEGAAAAKVPLRLESGPEGAMVALDVRTRQVLALVGNYEAVTGGLDRATQSRRQPGSTFKPIVYSYAIHSRRYTPASLVDVTPATFAGGYHPANFEGWDKSDPLRLREALANSVNVVAVRVLDDVGPTNVVQWAESLGIKSTIKPDLSMALGSYEVEPIELVGAYATFAAGGEYQEPTLVTKIVGPDGKELALPPTPPPRRVLDEAESYVVTNLMESVIDHGTGQRAKELRRPVAGKTGTSNQSKDTWFAGYTTTIAAVTWVGYDDGKPLGRNEQGAVTALPAWVELMKAASASKPPSEFPRPPGVTMVQIDTKTGKLPYQGDVDVMDEVFLAGTEPTEVGDPFLTDAGAPATNPYDDDAGTEEAQ